MAKDKNTPQAQTKAPVQQKPAVQQPKSQPVKQQNQAAKPQPQRQAPRNNARKPLSREERMAQDAKRIERKKEVIADLIDQNPDHTKLVTTEMNESKRLVVAIDEIETGSREVRINMGGSRLSWDVAQNILQSINWAQQQVERSVGLLNDNGFGTRRGIYEARQNRFDSQKHLNSTGTDALSIALKQRAELEMKHKESVLAVLKQRVEEDMASEKAHHVAIEALEVTIAEARAAAEAENKARTEAEKEARRKAHEARQKEIQEEKAKKKKAKQEAHEARMKEQQEAKAKKEAAKTANPQPVEEKKDEKSA